MGEYIDRADMLETWSDIYWVDERLNKAYGEDLEKIDNALRSISPIKTKAIRYFDTDELIWKVGEVIVNE